MLARKPADLGRAASIFAVLIYPDSMPAARPFRLLALITLLASASTGCALCPDRIVAVSYTHLTLPTILRV